MNDDSFIPLSAASHGTIKINSVSPALFYRSYFSRCLECGFCGDSCCNYGCDVTAAEEKRILAFEADIEKAIGIRPPDWFASAPVTDADYPSGSYRRTARRNGKCVFFTAEPRGCALHRLALGKGIQPRDIKPMICFLFPLTWDGSRLYVCDYLDELECKDHGYNIYQAQRGELLHYLGMAAVEELDSLANKITG